MISAGLVLTKIVGAAAGAAACGGRALRAASKLAPGGSFSNAAGRSVVRRVGAGDDRRAEPAGAVEQIPGAAHRIEEHVPVRVHRVFQAALAGRRQHRRAVEDDEARRALTVEDHRRRIVGRDRRRLHRLLREAHQHRVERDALGRHRRQGGPDAGVEVLRRLRRKRGEMRGGQLQVGERDEARSEIGRRRAGNLDRPQHRLPGALRRDREGDAGVELGAPGPGDDLRLIDDDGRVIDALRVRPAGRGGGGGLGACAARQRRRHEQRQAKSLATCRHRHPSPRRDISTPAQRGEGVSRRGRRGRLRRDRPPARPPPLPRGGGTGFLK